MRLLYSLLALALPLVAAQPKGYTIPTIDISGETHRQVIVDRESGVYLGHPSTLLLPDNRTILTTYPKGHGKGGIVYKKSYDGGLTWTDRLPTPENWATSLEVPTLFRLHDRKGKPRILMFSGKAAKAIGGRVRGAAQWATRHRKAPGSATVKTGTKPSVTLVSRLDYMDGVLSEAGVRLALEGAAGHSVKTG